MVAQFCSQGLVEVKLVYAKNAKWLLSGPHQLQKFAQQDIGIFYRNQLPCLTKSLPTPSFGNRFTTTFASNIPNGLSQMANAPMCDSYEARLIELLDTFTRTGSDQSVADIHRVLEQGLN